MAIRALSTAATGMIGQQQNIDVIANNLANVNTTGFKRSRANFEDLFYQKLQQAGVTAAEGNQIPTGLEIGLGTRLTSTAREHAQGAFEVTERELDWAIDGKGFFQLQFLDGTTGYTRDGAFNIDRDGRIVNSQGYPLAENITVPEDASAINLSPSGIVEAVLADGQTIQQLGQIQLANFINPSGLKAEGENIYRETNASGQPQLNNPGQGGVGVTRQRVLETSNVQVVTELVNMIRAQRAFELNSNGIQVADQMLQVVNNLRS